jgi:hypothetical protein
VRQHIQILAPGDANEPSLAVRFASAKVSIANPCAKDQIGIVVIDDLKRSFAMARFSSARNGTAFGFYWHPRNPGVRSNNLFNQRVHRFPGVVP